MREIAVCLLVLAVLFSAGCAQEGAKDEGTVTPSGGADDLYEEPVPVDRLTKIPLGAVKITPEMDVTPPVLHSDEWEEPVPLESGVNTAGAEDSPFILPDGKTLYFFFTPDVKVPAEKQLLDEVTGIWVSKKAGGVWQPAERVVLQDFGKLSLDGCGFAQDNEIWFCSAREGYTGLAIWKADRIGSRWGNWENMTEEFGFEFGEFHFSKDRTKLYYHRESGGDYDIFMRERVNGDWGEENAIEVVNTEAVEGWPWLSQDGSELWFLRTYMGTPAIYRAVMENDEWQEPELIISQFAGEPSLDNEGNLYFVHHFYKDGEMLEADIYFAKKK